MCSKMFDAVQHCHPCPDHVHPLHAQLIRIDVRLFFRRRNMYWSLFTPTPYIYMLWVLQGVLGDNVRRFGR